MADSFGDGWDDASFLLTDSYRRYRGVAPNCEWPLVALEYCFDPNKACDGDTLDATVFGLDPDFRWEVRTMYSSMVCCLAITCVV